MFVIRFCRALGQDPFYAAAGCLSRQTDSNEAKNRLHQDADDWDECMAHGPATPSCGEPTMSEATRERTAISFSSTDSNVKAIALTGPVSPRRFLPQVCLQQL
jgi:hypothetical protein